MTNILIRKEDAYHPLVEGISPSWASGWGQDEYGVWVEFTIGSTVRAVIQRMRWIPPGIFFMGSPDNEAGRSRNEGPRHQVRINEGFWLFDTPVTQDLWMSVMGDENPSKFQSVDRPLEQVSWEDCQEFISKINAKLPGLDLSLPSEAQWEYSCRAGTKTPFSCGGNITTDLANYDGRFPYKKGQQGHFRSETLPVRSFSPNFWGLYEMHGNVSEWCADVWHDGPEASTLYPKNRGDSWVNKVKELTSVFRYTGQEDSSAVYHVIRGGSWLHKAEEIRSAFRCGGQGNRCFESVGFRLLLVDSKIDTIQPQNVNRQLSFGNFNVLLASPRGFCAGVERAIETVKLSLSKYGKPVYVLHEIVHNKHVIDELKQLGAVFVEHLADVPKGEVCVFSAHGVSVGVEVYASDLGLRTIDATCPLVTSVHRMVEKYYDQGIEVLIIGHHNHPEVEGTAGRIPSGVQIVATEEEAKTLIVKNPELVGYVTQTTLCKNDVEGIIQILQARFPEIQGPRSNICFATQNRQDAVRSLAEKTDLIIVVGSKNSSSSNRLQEVAQSNGVNALIIEDCDDIDEDWFAGASNIGITAGTSTPESLVSEVLDWLKSMGAVEEVNEDNGVEENIHFKPADIGQRW